MIFKQGVLKEEKIKFGLFLASICIPIAILVAICLINKESIDMLMIVLSIVFCPLLLALFLLIKNLEWYIVYVDRIEVRCAFGKKNTVYYSDVAFIEEVKINLTSRGMKKTFYIFNDCRKNNNNLLDINSCYNCRKYNLKIYKTERLANFISDNLNLEVINTNKQDGE